MWRHRHRHPITLDPTRANTQPLMLCLRCYVYTVLILPLEVTGLVVFSLTLFFPTQVVLCFLVRGSNFLILGPFMFLTFCQAFFNLANKFQVRVLNKVRNLVTRVRTLGS